MARARLALAVTVVLLAAPSAVSAATFCVHDPPGCVGTVKGNIQVALNDTKNPAHPGRDLILVGPGTFNEGFNDENGNPVDIIGQGPGPGGTQLDLPNIPYPAQVGDPTSTVQGMALIQPGTTPLLLRGTGDRIRVHTDTDQPAVFMITGSALRRSTASSTDDAGVTVGFGAEDVAVEDSSLSGQVGITNAGEVTGRRLRLSASEKALNQQNETTTVLEDVLMTISGAGAVGAAVTPTTGDSSFSASHLTIVGDGSANQVGVYQTDGQNGGTPLDSTVNLRDSVIRDVTTHLFRQTFIGQAVLNVSYSDYDFSKVVDQNTSSGSGSINSTNNLNNVDPRFLDPAAGDYRLRPDSPLIDAGTPGGFDSGESATDLDGNPRLVDGTGDCAAVRDMGAFEFQPPARDPLARAGAPATGQAYEPITFDAAPSCDPDFGDSLSYSWAFDDGGTATGQSAQHAFARAGAHTGTVTVTDLTGRSATASATVNVIDDRLPLASALTMRPRTIVPANRGGSIVAARGARVRYALSEPAAVTFRVQRARKRRGRRTRYRTLKGRFTHAGQLGANSFRFTGRLRRRKLRPGRYRLVARPTDLSGNRGPATRRAFRVKRARGR